FSGRRRHTRFSRDWSSDVCSSDLATKAEQGVPAEQQALRRAVVEERDMAGGVTRDGDHVEMEACGAYRVAISDALCRHFDPLVRSEERRVGKEWSCREARSGSGRK